MKNKSIIALFVIALFSLTLSAFSGESPWVRNTLLTNLPSVLPANATSNLTHNLPLRPDRAFGIQVAGLGTSNATNNLSVGVRGSIDGVYSNSFPIITLTISVTGTNRFIAYTNMSLGSVPYIHLGPMTNGATGVTNLTTYLMIPK